MVLLDVVYNHFGPEGNYLHVYAPQFFTDRHQTPWGAAINFDGPDSRTVRDFFICTTRCTGSTSSTSTGCGSTRCMQSSTTASRTSSRELAAVVRRHSARPARAPRSRERPQRGALPGARCAWAGLLIATRNGTTTCTMRCTCSRPAKPTATTPTTPTQPVRRLGRCLAEGFAYQGEPSAFRGGARARRAERPTAAKLHSSVSRRTHDQVGNRARGERLSMLADADALRRPWPCVLLSPSAPMLFMGEEFAASSPFLFFCDFGPELAAAVTRGRRNEFSRFERYRDPASQAAIPDPNDLETFRASRLDWSELVRAPHAEWRAFYASLLRKRAAHITPLLDGTAAGGSWEVEGHVLRVDWLLAGGSSLHLIGNFGEPASALLPDGEADPSAAGCAARCWSARPLRSARPGGRPRAA